MILTIFEDGLNDIFGCLFLVVYMSYWSIPKKWVHILYLRKM